MYIPVEDDTLGLTLKLSSKGLKMTPPPRPTAPAIKPAPNALAKNWAIILVVHCKSPSTKLYPYSVFTSNSRLTKQMLTTDITIKNKTVINKREMSPGEHDSMPTMDDILDVPRNNVSNNRVARRNGIIIKLVGFQWVRSRAMIFISFGCVFGELLFSSSSTLFSLAFSSLFIETLFDSLISSFSGSSISFF